MKRLLILAALAALAGCSPDRSEPAQTEPAPAAAASVPASSGRVGVLRDPTPIQISALAADWTGEPLDLDAAVERDPAYLEAALDQRDEVRSGLAAAAAPMLEAARNVGVLELTTEVRGASFQPEEQVYHLPVFFPGSSIRLGAAQSLRLTNAEAAYRLTMDSPAAQAMRARDVQPASVRLSVLIDHVRPTLHGSEIIGTLQTFTLYDRNGGEIGGAVSMTAVG